MIILLSRGSHYRWSRIYCDHANLRSDMRIHTHFHSGMWWCLLGTHCTIVDCTHRNMRAAVYTSYLIISTSTLWLQLTTVQLSRVVEGRLSTNYKLQWSTATVHTCRLCLDSAGRSLTSPWWSASAQRLQNKTPQECQTANALTGDVMNDEWGTSSGNKMA